MFCPFCGAKNAVEPGGTCFVCEKRLPAFDEPGKSRGASQKGAAPAAIAPSGAPGFEPIASLGDRLLAIVLDTVFLISFFAIAFTFAGTRAQQIETMFPSRLWMSASVAGAIVLISFLYWFLLEGFFGATLGKAVAGIQVRPNHGLGRPGFRASLWRNLLRLVDGIGFYLLGFFIALFSPRRKRLGDFAAGTIVVQRQMATAEKITVVLIWLIGVAGFAWGAYTVCPRCVDLNVAAVMERIGLEKRPGASASVPHLASN